MPNIWNSLVNWDDDEELRRRFAPAMYGANPGVDNAIPGTPAANPSLRRMASQGGFIGSDNPTLATVPDRLKNLQLPTDTTQIDSGVPRAAYDGAGGLSAGLSVERPKSRVEADVEELQNAIDMPARTDKAKKRSKFSRFWRGAGDAWKRWDGNGGLLGLAGSMIEQGVDESVHPSARAERVKKQGLSKIWNRYGQNVALETAEQKRQQEQIKTAADLSKYRIDAAAPALKGRTDDDDFSEADSADYFARTGIYIPPYDKREYDLTWVNGKPMIKPKKGGKGYVRDASLPDKTEDVSDDITIETPNGPVTLPLKPGQAANTLVQAQVRAERAAQVVQQNEQRQADKEYSDARDYQQDLRSWSERQVKAKAQKAKASAALVKMREALADPQNQAFTGDISKNIAVFEGDIAEADELMKEKKPAKIMRGSPKSKAGGKRKFSQSDIDRVIQGK